MLPPTTFSGNFFGKKKKKIRPLGVAAIHPNGQGERDPATSSSHFCLRQTQKKSGQSKKLFLMSQKSILMSQNSFLMPQN
jgi:hypothetical protein